MVLYWYSKYNFYITLTVRYGTLQPPNSKNHIKAKKKSENAIILHTFTIRESAISDLIHEYLCSKHTKLIMSCLNNMDRL